MDLAPLEGQAGATPISAGTGAATAGFDPAATERLLDGLDMPTRSPALARLFARLFGARDGLLAGDAPEQAAMRIEAMLRTGRIAEADQLASRGGHPAIAVLSARAALAAGDVGRACDIAARAVADKSTLPRALAIEVVLTQGYCFAAEGRVREAGLAAQLAREVGAGSEPALVALDAIATGDMPVFARDVRLGVLDWRIAALNTSMELSGLITRAHPAARVAVALDQGGDVRVRLEAAEAAAQLNLIGGQQLAAAYRALPAGVDAIAQAQSAQSDPVTRRALLYQAVLAERTPFQRTRLIRTLLDDARRAGLYLPALALLAGPIEALQPVAEIGWFAETAVEAMLASGRHDRARAWVSLGTDRGGGASLTHWLALIDIASPVAAVRRGDTLGSAEELALRGRFSAEALHRLATVLDALDYNVPLRLWEAASRTPQPTSGHLPATGVLSDLQDAARRKDQARTILLAVRALGPGASEGANIIALGDVVRALKRVGLEADARQIAFESLFALWPRAGNS